MSIESEGTIEIAAATEDVFEWLVDAEKQRRWLGDKVEWIAGERTELHEGYKGTEKIGLSGNSSAKPEPAEAEVEVTAYDAPQELEVEFTGRMVKVRTRFELERTTAGTVLNNKTSTDYRGVAKIGGPIAAAVKDIDVEGIQRKGISAGLARLKDLVETG